MDSDLQCYKADKDKGHLDLERLRGGLQQQQQQKQANQKWLQNGSFVLVVFAGGV